MIDLNFRRYHPAPLELLLCLCQMGLVTPAKPFPHSFNHVSVIARNTCSCVCGFTINIEKFVRFEDE